MSLAESIRSAQAKVEAIPALGAIFYDFIPKRILERPERRIAGEVLGHIKIGTILDIGSGTGFLALEIAENNPRLKVYGIDLSPQMVRIASRHSVSVRNVRFIVADAAEIPFENESMDFIVSTGALHHWSRPGKVFEECHRVLKSGREAWIYDPCPDALSAEPEKAKKEYGRFGYRLRLKIFKLHGFTLEEYNQKVRGLVENTRFKDSYGMVLTDMWMKTTLRKQRRD